MKRRHFLGAGLAAGLVAPSAIAATTRVRPTSPGWPREGDWTSLNRAVGGRLSKVEIPDLKNPAVAQQSLLRWGPALSDAEFRLAGRVALESQRLRHRS